MGKHKPEGTYIKSQKRWTKNIDGKRFYVSCKTLGVLPGREHGKQRAKEYWKELTAELRCASRIDLGWQARRVVGSFLAAGGTAIADNSSYPLSKTSLDWTIRQGPC